MKITVQTNLRGESGCILGGRYKTIYEADEDIDFILTPTPYRMWSLKITRNSILWIEVFVSDSQITKLKLKLKKHDSSSIICPSKEPIMFFGHPAGIYLSCTDEGLLEVIDENHHRFILGIDYSVFDEAYRRGKEQL